MAILPSEVFRAMHKQGTGYTGQGKSDRGFYIILAICLTVIVVSSYILFVGPGKKEEPMDETLYLPSTTHTVQTPVAVPNVDLPAEPAEPTVQPEPVKEPEKKPEPPKPEPSKKQTAAEAPAPIWIKPVDGAVLKPFSGDALVKDETMGDWRVHTGTDYAADAGTRVYAVSDGTVERAAVDPLYGGIVVLNLKDGKQAVYQCLGEKLKVKTGDKVRAGDVIGTVGAIGYAEAAQESHLHVELYKGGKPIDPESVFGKAKTSAEQKPAVDASVPQSKIDVEE